MPARKGPPVPEEAWPIIRAFRDELRLTYNQIGSIVGLSGSRVKQKLNGYTAYQTESGGWSAKRPEVPGQLSIEDFA